jgi:hypothetical protein
MSDHLDKLNQALEVMGEVYVQTGSQRVERELSLAKLHVDRARALLAGNDPDTLTYVVQSAGKRASDAR